MAVATVTLIKCRKCNFKICESPPMKILSAHEEQDTCIASSECASLNDKRLLFLDSSDLPIFLSDCIEKAVWTKGKILCPNCQGKLGTFDFVSGSKCDCLAHVLPPVHLVRSKIDVCLRK